VVLGQRAAQAGSGGRSKTSDARELQEQPNGSKRELLTEGTDECHYLVG
jgi:hypothetical protein